MNKKQLGHTDLQVAPLAFGCNVFGWTINEPKSFELLDALVASGCNLLDTADVYSKWKPGNAGGESETIIGKWMKQRNNRSKVIVATKVGGDMGKGKALSKECILSAAEDSLQRLQTDYIDLYQTHFDDAATPVEETLEAYAQLVKQGKVKWIGASNLAPARLTESIEASKKNGYPVYQTLQPQYNLCERELYEKELEPICLQNGLGVLNYYSLAAGFLTGKYRSEQDLGKSVRGGGAKKYLNTKGYAILHALDTVAAELDTTAATVAIAWLIARPSITAPIASATNMAQLNELLKATFLELPADAVDLLNIASDWK
ncbi:MAG: alcohol dehydrogenase [Ferruginibacter sp.]|nr:alcohol dehydrogenase [Ferruginibacter sp.]